MLKIKAHYRFDAPQAKRASLEQVLGRPLPTGKVQDEELPQDAQAAINDYQAELNTNNGSREQGMTNGVSEYQKTKDTKSFKDKMNEQREKDKQRSEQEIDKLYDKLITAGEQNPGAQEAILKVTIAISEFANALWGSFVDFITNLANKIAAWVNEAFTKVRDWVNGAVDSVSKFFSGLFSVA